MEKGMSILYWSGPELPELQRYV